MRTSLTLWPNTSLSGRAKYTCSKTQCDSGAAGNGLIDRNPCRADDQHLARLDVAHVGGADQVERAGFGRHRPRIAEAAERQRTEAVRIAHGDQVSFVIIANENAPVSCVTDSTIASSIDPACERA